MRKFDGPESDQIYKKGSGSSFFHFIFLFILSEIFGVFLFFIGWSLGFFKDLFSLSLTIIGFIQIILPIVLLIYSIYSAKIFGTEFGFSFLIIFLVLEIFGIILIIMGSGLIQNNNPLGISVLIIGILETLTFVFIILWGILSMFLFGVPE